MKARCFFVAKVVDVEFLILGKGRLWYREQIYKKIFRGVDKNNNHI